MRFLTPLLVLVPSLASAVPMTFQNQGRLFDALGSPLTGSQDLTFRLYSTETGGSSVWDETITTDVEDGFYSVELGNSTSIDTATFAGSDDWYITVAVGTGPETDPRLAINSVPYALVSDWAANADSADNIVDGAVINASELQIGGTTVIDSSGQLAGAALGSHDHAATEIVSGKLSIDRIPVGSSSTDVAAGDHTHSFADITGQITGDLVVGGGVTIGDVSTSCSGSNVGQVRFDGTTFEGCTAGGWVTLGGGNNGRTGGTAAASCLDIKSNFPGSGDGIYWVDPTDSGSPFEVYCDMTTDGGGWTLTFHLYDMAGLSEDTFISNHGDVQFTDHDWTFDGGTDTLGTTRGTPEPGAAQGNIDIAAFDGTWSDVRMACNASSNNLDWTHWAQINDYATANGNHQLLGSAANGTAYDVLAGTNSFGNTTVWHDNETASLNGGHYLCDYTTTATNGTSQFSFCYTDHLNNDNTLDQGDSIVGIAFGTNYGSDGWSTGFSAECGNMGASYLSDAGTFAIWIR